MLAQVDPVTGGKTTPDGVWSLMPIDVRMGFNILFTPESGDNTGCPLVFGGEFM